MYVLSTLNEIITLLSATASLPNYPSQKNIESTELLQPFTGSAVNEELNNCTIEYGRKLKSIMVENYTGTAFAGDGTLIYYPRSFLFNTHPSRLLKLLVTTYLAKIRVKTPP